MTKEEYQKLLDHPEWQKKRLRILKRDNYCCKKCGRNNIQLHVHHTYYIQGRKPWEYPDKALETLCCICHEIEHEKPLSSFLKSKPKKNPKKKKNSRKNKKRVIVLYKISEKKVKHILSNRDKVLQEKYEKLRKKGKIV